MSDAKSAKLQADYDRLKKKRATYQAHLKLVAQVASSEASCAAMIEFIGKHAANDQMVNPGSNPYTVPPGGKGCCG